MSSIVKAGSWYFRVDPHDSKQLQRSFDVNDHWSVVCRVASEILDIDASGEDVVISTKAGIYIRDKSGNVYKQ